MSEQSLSDAIDMLADEIESGHLLAATGGGLLLEAAAEDIKKLKTKVERLRAWIAEQQCENPDFIQCKCGCRLSGCEHCGWSGVVESDCNECEPCKARKALEVEG